MHDRLDPDILDAVDSGVFLLNVTTEEARFALANPHCRELFAAASLESQWEGKPLHQCLNAPVAEALAKCVAECVARRERVTGELSIEGEGGVEAIAIALVPKFASAPEAAPDVQVVGSCHDLTPLRQLERSLRGSEERFLQLIRKNTDGVVVVDREGIVRFVNPAAEELFNRHARELEGEQFGLPIVGGDKADVDILRKGGTTTPAELRIVQIDEASNFGEPIYAIASLRDISQRRQAEQSLRLMERAIAASGNGIAIADARRPDLPLVYVNPAFERITGYAAAEVLGRNSRFLHGSDRQQPGLEEIRRSLREQKECRVLLRNYRKDGTQFWNELYVSPVFDEEGNLTHFVAVQNDITERVRAEERLRESEAQLRTILLAVKEGITFSDRQGHFYVYNPEMEALTGYTQAEANASGDFTRLIFPDAAEREAALRGLQALDRLGATHEGDVRIHAKDGTVRHVLVSTTLVSYEGRDMYLSAYRDITERKLHEENQRQQRERERLLESITLRIREDLNLDRILSTTVEEVRQLLQADRVAVYRFAPDWSGQFVVESVAPGWLPLVNQQYYDPCFGTSHAILYQQGRVSAIADVSSADVSPCHRALLAPFQVKANLVVPVLRRQQLWGLLIAHQCAAPRQWQELEIDLLRQLADRVGIAIQQAELYHRLQDLNATLEQQVAERTAELEQSRRDLQEYIDAMATFNSKLDTEGRILTVNEAARAAANLPLEQLLGQLFWQCPWWEGDTDTQERVKAAIAAATRSSATYIEARVSLPDGGYIDTNLGFIPVCDRDGTVKYLIAEAHDVTDLQRALAQEKELGELKSRFVSMVSHEFRTPLATIQAASDLLKYYAHKMTETRRMDRLNKIQAEVRHMTELLEDVLTIGKIEAKRLQFQPAPLDMEDFCRNLVAEVGATATPTHRIEFHSTGACTNQSLDSRLLRQIITNLLSNAIKYSPQGGKIEFLLACHPEGVTIEVRDEGIGIPPADRDRIFESFYRADNASSIPGTGLGLAIVKSSVELHGGEVHADSRPDGGTAFVVTLPSAVTTCDDYDSRH